MNALQLQKITLVCVLLAILITTGLYAGDSTTDTANPFILDKKKNNFYYMLSSLFQASSDSTMRLLYKRPHDRFYPKADLMFQGSYTYPVNRNFGLGPSLFTQNILYLSEDQEGTSAGVHFDATMLAGMSFVITPFMPVIEKPAFFLFVDAGPMVMVTNKPMIGELIEALPGVYSSQLLILPVMPIHLFIMDLNVIGVARTTTPEGVMPGVRLRNHFTMKFALLNFIHKDIRSGLRVKNIFSHILTGKPFTGDLANEYTYDRLYLSWFWNGLPGLELETGYGFEYYTYAREADYHTAHKVFTGFAFTKEGFNTYLKTSFNFWSSGIRNGMPVFEFETGFSYSKERF